MRSTAAKALIAAGIRGGSAWHYLAAAATSCLERGARSSGISPQEIVMSQSESLITSGLRGYAQHLQEERYSRALLETILMLREASSATWSAAGKPLNRCRRPTSSAISMD